MKAIEILKNAEQLINKLSPSQSNQLKKQTLDLLNKLDLASLLKIVYQIEKEREQNKDFLSWIDLRSVKCVENK